MSEEWKALIPAAKCGDLQQLKLQNINSEAANYSEMKYSEYSTMVFVLHEHPEVVISWGKCNNPGKLILFTENAASGWTQTTVWVLMAATTYQAITILGISALGDIIQTQDWKFDVKLNI